MNNPYVPVLRQLFDRLNEANGLMHHLDWQLQTFKTSLSEQLPSLRQRRGDAEIPEIWSTTSLIVSDLTKGPGALNGLPSGRFGTKGEQYLTLADRLVSRYAAWAVAQGWEVYESFLLDIITLFYAQNPSAVDTRTIQNFLKKSGRSQPQALEEWREFVRWDAGTDNQKLLKRLRTVAPDFAAGETSNWRNLDLAVWYRVLAKVRHAVTHSELTIPADDLAVIRSNGKHFVNMFPGHARERGYELAMSVKDAELQLTLVGEHGFLVFKALSFAGGLDWQALNTPRLVT